MSILNIAIPLPQTKRDEITTKLAEARSLFPVLAPLSTDDSKRLQTIAEGREPYVAEAYSEAANNPQTVPGTIAVNEWGNLEEQSAALGEIESQLVNLLDIVQATRARIGDARYENVLRYYRYIRDGADKLPSAQTIADKIGRLFDGQGNRAKKTTPATPKNTASQGGNS